MSGVICALAGGGQNRYQGSATVTVGQYYDPNPSFSFVYYGYSTGLIGSVSPTTWAQTNDFIRSLTFVQILTAPTSQWITFQVEGSEPNSGWTTMVVNGTPLNRVDATYSTGTNTTWTWFGAANSFGTTIGATRLVTWS